MAAKDAKQKEAPSLESIPGELPLLPLRDLVLFPSAVLPITIGRESSIALVNSLGENRFLGVVTQRDPHLDTPGPTDLHSIGSVGIIHKVVRMPNQSLFVFCEGIYRARVTEILAATPFLRARLERVEETSVSTSPEIEALRQNIISVFQQIVAQSPSLSEDLHSIAVKITEPGRLADFMAASLPTLTSAERQEVLAELDVRRRLDLILLKLAKELEVLQLRSKIQSSVQDQVSQSQREFYLREQMKAIQKELGEGDEHQRDIEELRRKIEARSEERRVGKECRL